MNVVQVNVALVDIFLEVDKSEIRTAALRAEAPVHGAPTQTATAHDNPASIHI